MASRRKGRILAFQALYFWDSSSFSGDKFPEKDETILEGKPSKMVRTERVSVDELVKFAWLEDKKIENLKDILDFSRVLIAGTIENIDEIDKLIKEHLENWDITRVNRVDLAVLRISAYTLLFQDEFPASIVIGEAIGICREYGSDDSFKFVNGVLDNVRKTLESRRPAAPKKKEKS
jgi:N utilization substance protein B